jgi:S-adenosylmethionine:tRNA ribosyltransferase-isomerase
MGAVVIDSLSRPDRGRWFRSARSIIDVVRCSAVRTADIDYDLPQSAIAQIPVEPRDAARLLVDRGAETAPEHRHVHDLPDLLQPGDLVVVNDTRVLPARIKAHRATGGAVEVLLLEPLDPDGDDRSWEALVRPSRKLAAGEVVTSDSSPLTIEIGAPTGDGTRHVRLLGDVDPLTAIAAAGQMPLPPYITTPLADPYQTVYSRRPASAAAPTAGLHITSAVLDALAARDIGLARVELVVGLDTFKPLTVDDPDDHVMHAEAYRVEQGVLARCRATRAAGGRVVAIGTTATRALESAARFGRSGRTTLFIRRPYDWQIVDVLLTNFHLPRSTLLLMIDAFVGPRWRALYECALAEHYRFLSFGDAMLLERGAP